MLTNSKSIPGFAVAKTIKMEAKPVAPTKETLVARGYLQCDKELVQASKVLQSVLDDFYVSIINDKLKTPETSDELNKAIDTFDALRSKKTSVKKERDEFNKAKQKLLASIANRFNSKAVFSADDAPLGNIFSKDVIKNHFIEDIKSEGNHLRHWTQEEVDAVEKIDAGFYTILNQFFQKRAFIFGAEEKHGTIAYRCINDNLPRFLDNIHAAEKNDILKKLTEYFGDKISEWNINMMELKAENAGEYCIANMFDKHHFLHFLSQENIDWYNQVIGGYSCSDGSHERGLNELIQDYNQHVSKSERLPKFKVLYKQILSEKKSFSFIPQQFLSDEEVFEAIKNLNTAIDDKPSLMDDIAAIANAVKNISTYNTEKVYINSKKLSTFSTQFFGKYNSVKVAWCDRYVKSNPKANDDKIQQEYKRNKCFSIQKIADLMENDEFVKKFTEEVESKLELLNIRYNDCINTVVNGDRSKILYKDEKKKEIIKNLLDSILDIKNTINIFDTRGIEVERDEGFYQILDEKVDSLSRITAVYDKCRNYLARKPYSTDKIKMNFNCSTFLSGWSSNDELKSAMLILHDQKYYIAILENKLTESEKKALYSVDEKSDKGTLMCYRYINDAFRQLPRMLIYSQKNPYAPAKIRRENLALDKLCIDNDIYNIFIDGKYTTKFAEKNPEEYKKNLAAVIDYFKEGVRIHPSFAGFTYDFKPTSEYKKIDEFYQDITSATYAIEKQDINYGELIKMVDNGQAYLFQFYNKDFNPNKHKNSTEKIHTTIFKNIFEENSSVKLNGGAEMFYRPASLKLEETTIHYANQPIKNKNPITKETKKESTYNYDIIKNRRYTEDKFFIHMAVTLNRKAYSKDNRCITTAVKKILHESDKTPNIIAFDRGERNLIYLCVIDGDGNILEQRSLNEIISSCNGRKYKVDYHDLLERREKERMEARVDWQIIKNIKEIKEGYISQVVNEVCKLVVKYDAIIALEDLNSGFKHLQEGKVEKAVYNKFERMLISKLNCLTFKGVKPDDKGGINNPYQLTDPIGNVGDIGRQDGIIFYVPPAYTSKVDPTTGFANLLHPYAKTIEEGKAFVRNMDNISYNDAEDYFEFTLNYKNFPKSSWGPDKTWTVCSYGDRVKTFQNDGGYWESQWFNPTNYLKDLFARYRIDIYADIKEQILNISDKKFFKDLCFAYRSIAEIRNSWTNKPEIDYILSPVKNEMGKFFDSREYNTSEESKVLPKDADANGAYNIALKAKWAIEKLQQYDESTNNTPLEKYTPTISNIEWLEYIAK